VSPSTPEERRDAIIKAIETNENIGYNELQRETEIPKKTLDNYLAELIEEKIITPEKLGEKPNSKVKFIVNFSDDTKKSIRHNLVQTTQFDLSFYDTKYRKSNTFPHLLQGLASENYQNLMSYFFDSIPAYTYGVKRIEEFLKKEKEKFDKEFTKKEKVRLHDACQEVQFVLMDNAWSAMGDAEDRSMHRTRDEVIADCNEPQKIERGTQHHKDEYEKKSVKVKWGLDNFRVGFIEDKQTKEVFIKVANEYNELSQKLSTLKIRLAWMVHGPPWKPKNLQYFD